MNGLNYADYFLNPSNPTQRRYEAIRSVVVEEQSMREVAQQFELSYGTIRNWVSEFYRTYATGQVPPFSFHPPMEDQPQA